MLSPRARARGARPSQRELLKRLRSVDLFKQLDGEQLGLLAKSMSERHYRKDEQVFAQGSIGFEFFIITKGQALVLRVAEGATQPIVLASLKQWDSFGERALLRNDLRYASIQAHGADLTCLSIARSVLAEALGGDPEELLEERQYAVKAHTAEEADRLEMKAMKQERKQMLQALQDEQRKGTDRMHGNSKKDDKALMARRAATAAEGDKRPGSQVPGAAAAAGRRGTIVPGTPAARKGGAGAEA